MFHNFLGRKFTAFLKIIFLVVPLFLLFFFRNNGVVYFISLFFFVIIYFSFLWLLVNKVKRLIECDKQLYNKIDFLLKDDYSVINLSKLNEHQIGMGKKINLLISKIEKMSMESKKIIQTLEPKLFSESYENNNFNYTGFLKKYKENYQIYQIEKEKIKKNVAQGKLCNDHDKSLISERMKDSLQFAKNIQTIIYNKLYETEVELKKNNNEGVYKDFYKDKISIINQINIMSNELDDLNNLTKKGLIFFRGNIAKFEPVLQKIMGKFNDILDNFSYPINDFKKVLKEFEEKNLLTRVVGNYYGEYRDLAENINNCISNNEKIINDFNFSVEFLGVYTDKINTALIETDKIMQSKIDYLENIIKSLETIKIDILINLNSIREAINLSDFTVKSISDNYKMISSLASDEDIEENNKIVSIIKNLKSLLENLNKKSIDFHSKAQFTGDYKNNFHDLMESINIFITDNKLELQNAELFNKKKKKKYNENKDKIKKTQKYLEKLGEKIIKINNTLDEYKTNSTVVLETVNENIMLCNDFFNYYEIISSNNKEILCVINDLLCRILNLKKNLMSYNTYQNKEEYDFSFVKNENFEDSNKKMYEVNSYEIISNNELNNIDNK